MNTRTLSVVAGAVALAAALVGSTPALAATTTDSEYARAVQLNAKYLGAAPSSVPAADRALLAKYATLASTTSKSTVTEMTVAEAKSAGLSPQANAAPMASGCYTGRSSYTGRALTGNTLYEEWVVLRWCISGGTVTSASRAESGYKIIWFGWSGLGYINGGTGVVSNIGKAWVQYGFQYQLGTPFPTQTTTPCIRAKGFNTANYTTDQTCSIY